MLKGRLGALFLVLLGFASQAFAASTVHSVRFGQHPDHVRFVMELSQKVDYTMTTLADPYRIVLDFPRLDWSHSATQPPKLYGAVQNFRYGVFSATTSRIVLDANAPLGVKQLLMLPPRGSVKNWRLVMDLAPTTRSAFLKNMQPAQYPEPPKAVASLSLVKKAEAATVAPQAPVVQARVPSFLPPTKPALKTKHTVVIDAGHGGVDPGAIGRSGGYEKHITLAMAKQLRDALRKTGRYNVVLTRDRDIFIPLRKRTAIARSAGADLFISLHADTIKNRNIRGFSVYTLSERASDKEAQALAERENKADLIAGFDLSTQDDDLGFILLDMAQRDTKNQSSRFAETLVKDVSRKAKVLRNPHRFAGFAVLKAPDVPSVLIELGFLSNKEDERALRSKKHRAKVAEAIKTSINRYFNRIEEANR